MLRLPSPPAGLLGCGSWPSPHCRQSARATLYEQHDGHVTRLRVGGLDGGAQSNLAARSTRCLAVIDQQKVGIAMRAMHEGRHLYLWCATLVVGVTGARGGGGRRIMADGLVGCQEQARRTPARAGRELRPFAVRAHWNGLSGLRPGRRGHSVLHVAQCTRPYFRVDCKRPTVRADDWRVCLVVCIALPTSFITPVFVPPVMTHALAVAADTCHDQTCSEAAGIARNPAPRCGSRGDRVQADIMVRAVALRSLVKCVPARHPSPR